MQTIIFGASSIFTDFTPNFELHPGSKLSAAEIATHSSLTPYTYQTLGYSSLHLNIDLYTQLT